ncbi:E3 ubiquitin-protein ligase RNF169 isoform X1 [Monodelphis domestica]|uniref:E3 ubiquitin-protein ligase RNF169 isoform X1 n=1 Tax=Monodelphis domestica TaxID=13616 RepID=UPI0024E25DF5|nr:E3 ubiquitin-protein ligase RNF169 isoform X1 [Monodelphis domestica]
MAAAASLRRRGRRRGGEELAAGTATAACPGCLAEAGVLPRGHSLGRPPLATEAGPGPGPGPPSGPACCPRCGSRNRPLGRARRRPRSRPSGLAEAELWERLHRGRRRHRRLDGDPAGSGLGADAAGAEEQRAAVAEEDFIFRAPIKLSKPGELREEYESLRKLKEEKLEEEKTSEDLIHKLLLEDIEAGKRRMEEVQKKDEPLVLCPERLSDSENEEPSQGKMTHRSAFVSKSSVYSLAFLTGCSSVQWYGLLCCSISISWLREFSLVVSYGWNPLSPHFYSLVSPGFLNLNSRVERSQSCNDTAQDRAKSRIRSVPTNKAKVTAVTPASNPIVGVLLSTQNNRCFSAPDLTVEKRLPFSSLSSLSSLHKPERSISPESNDSISEELNHFKPIVCSPCTPPKRLPDGRVLSPLIIKSTPRNLTRTLQKQTSYEASPRILKKWEQIFQERQIKKTLSKATLTSMPSETGEDFLIPEVVHSSKEQPGLALHVRLFSEQVSSDHPTLIIPEPDYFPSVSQAKVERRIGRKSSAKILLETDYSLESKGRANGAILDSQGFEGSETSTDSDLDKSWISTDVKFTTRKIMAINPALPENNTLGVVLKTTKKQLKTLNHFELPNGNCDMVETISDAPLPPLRRGRKRHCKTKHLEQNGSFKKLRQNVGEVGLTPGDPVFQEMEQKLQQEEEDRQLALQLQHMFDNESRIVSRRKGGTDQYLLRSNSTTGAK